MLSSGGVKCWGYNSDGQLGDGTTDARSNPTDVQEISDVATISAGGVHTCAVLSSGGVKCWGGDQYDQIGDDTSTGRRTPEAVAGLNLRS